MIIVKYSIIVFLYLIEAHSLPNSAGVQCLPKEQIFWESAQQFRPPDGTGSNPPPQQLLIWGEGAEDVYGDVFS